MSRSRCIISLNPSLVVGLPFNDVLAYLDHESTTPSKPALFLTKSIHSYASCEGPYASLRQPPIRETAQAVGVPAAEAADIQAAVEGAAGAADGERKISPFEGHNIFQFKNYFVPLRHTIQRNAIIMATVTLEYNIRNKQARQMIESIQSLGLATRKKTGLEEALEDVAKGRLTTIHTPQNRKTE